MNLTIEQHLTINKITKDFTDKDLKKIEMALLEENKKKGQGTILYRCNRTLAFSKVR